MFSRASLAHRYRITRHASILRYLPLIIPRRLSAFSNVVASPQMPPSSALARWILSTGPLAGRSLASSAVSSTLYMSCLTTADKAGR